MQIAHGGQRAVLRRHDRDVLAEHQLSSDLSVVKNASSPSAG
jgi:hypothetical protein